MNCTLVFFTLMFAAVVYSLPAPVALENLVPELEDDSLRQVEPQLEEHVRFKRATCDLFSFSSKWVTPNHAACAAHCIARGNRGGYCKKTICHCRK